MTNVLLTETRRAELELIATLIYNEQKGTLGEKLGCLNSLRQRIISDLVELEVLVGILKVQGLKIVLTMGTFDLYHVGHGRYIFNAGLHGSVLIVGVEDDKKARGRKGENRPVVPYIERSELLLYHRSVSLVAQKSYDHAKWAMIKVVHPDVLIAVQGTYSNVEVEQLKEFCGEVVVLPRQAETSTSAKIRKMVLDGADNLSQLVIREIPALIERLYEEMKKGTK